MCQKRETTAMDFNVFVIRKQMWLDVYLIFQLSRALGSWESQLFKKYEYCTCDAAIVWLSGCIFIQSQTEDSLMEDAHLFGYKMRSFYDACENRVYTILGEKKFFLMANFNHMTCSKSEWWLQNQVKCMAKNFDKLS